MTLRNEPVLIIGLGNPGPRYAGNRHNIGFLVADELADRVNGKFKSHRSGAAVIETRIAGVRSVLAKPQSFMNLAGGPVSSLARFYNVAPTDVFVVHDELDLPFGTIRIKRSGGENGHNGLRSITKSLSTRDYVRIRFGVDRPPGRMDAAEYVLKDFAAVERKELGFLVDRCADIVESVIADGVEATQNRFHGG